MQIAAAMEAIVVAVDIFDDKLAEARDGGRWQRSTPAAFTVQQSIKSLRKGGRHVQAGLTSREERGEVAIPIDILVNREWATCSGERPREQLRIVGLRVAE